MVTYPPLGQQFIYGGTSSFAMVAKHQITHKGVKILINIPVIGTAYTDTNKNKFVGTSGSLQVTYICRDSCNPTANDFPLLSSPVLSPNSTSAVQWTMTIYPGVTSVANQNLNDVVGQSWHADTTVLSGAPLYQLSVVEYP